MASIMLPSPGSDEAVEQGCLCPVLDNNHGKGFKWGTPETCFWRAADCPLHGYEHPTDPRHIGLKRVKPGGLDDAR